MIEAKAVDVQAHFPIQHYWRYFPLINDLEQVVFPCSTHFPCTVLSVLRQSFLSTWNVILQEISFITVEFLDYLHYCQNKTRFQCYQRQSTNVALGMLYFVVFSMIVSILCRLSLVLKPFRNPAGSTSWQCSSFLASRLLIIPVKSSYQCDCRLTGLFFLFLFDLSFCISTYPSRFPCSCLHQKCIQQHAYCL